MVEGHKYLASAGAIGIGHFLIDRRSKSGLIMTHLYVLHEIIITLRRITYRIFTRLILTSEEAVASALKLSDRGRR